MSFQFIVSLLTLNNLFFIALGWLVFPQPLWVQKTHTKIITYFKNLLHLS